ncbi:MAG: redoxin domain-containing protein, partial [Chitinophagales bacterium]
MKILSKFALCFLIICSLMMGLSHQTQAQMVGGNIGSIAPNIELPDQYGNKVSLSGLRGNLVLVRFWKSGDPNSRATNSNIYALHQKYKNASFKGAKGFEVFMVSLDSRLDKWKMAMQQDQLPANYHVNDIYSKYVAPYGVRNLPANFLLDPNGVIIAQTKSMAELDMELGKRAQIYATNGGRTTTTTTTTSVPSTPRPTISSSDLINTSDTPAPATFNQITQPSSIGTHSMAADEITYMIQLGAFKNWDMDKFLDASEYGLVTAEEVGNGVKRALLGKYSTPEDMVSTLSKLRDKGYKDAFPVEYTGNARRIIGKKETQGIASQMGITVTEAVITTPPPSAAPATMSIANSTPAPANNYTVNSTPTTPQTHTTTSGASGQYQYPFPVINGDNNPITSIPDDAISATYHSGSNSVITTTTPNSNNYNAHSSGNVATHHSGGTITNNSTLVPSEIPVFTGGVTPSANYNTNQGTYYDSDAYELSWYPSEPSQTQPNIIESPYYNQLPASGDPNAPTVPNYDNGNNGWQQGQWQSTNGTGTSNGSGWTTTNGGTTNNNGSGWTTTNG